MIPKGDPFSPLFNKTSMILRQTKKIREKKMIILKTNPQKHVLLNSFTLLWIPVKMLQTSLKFS